MHAIVFADGPLEAKNAQVTGESEICYGLMERTKTEPSEQGDEHSLFVGVRPDSSLMQNAMAGSQKLCFPPRTESTFPQVRTSLNQLLRCLGP